jgi:molybdopterin molybdotransferase
MDGFAVRAEDMRGATASAPITLELAGGGDAGDGDPPPLQPGTAWRVATGGRVPSGADSVVRREDTTAANAPARTVVTFVNDRDARRNVRPAGGDVAAGATVLHAGAAIHPGALAMLAALGEAAPIVYRKPRVAILTSGNEVAPLEQLDAIRAGTRIADVNAPLLEALIQRSGGVPLSLGLAPDDPAAIANAITAARDADLVISAGGISVGEMDHVMTVMERLAARVVFRRVALRPGGPTTFAVLPDGTPWLALPGNPVSAFVTFHLFAGPAIRAMSGDPEPMPSASAARLSTTLIPDTILDQYLRVVLQPAEDGGPPWARLTGNQGSWVLSSLVGADALAIIEAGSGGIPPGTELRVLNLET